MTLIDKIRQETKAIHSRLDKIELTKQLMRKDVTIKNYADYLQCFYALHVIVEPVLYKQAAIVFPDITKNQRLESLLKDLKTLGISEFQVEFPVVEKYFSPNAVLGALYVMEGSRLGGRHIASFLRDNLTDQKDYSFYFLEEKPDVGWATIFERLSACKQNESEEIIESAIYMFKFVEELLEKAFFELNEKN